jgi:hypothetical protein
VAEAAASAGRDNIQTRLLVHAAAFHISLLLPNNWEWASPASSRATPERFPHLFSCSG